MTNILTSDGRYNKCMTYLHSHHQLPKKAPYMPELHDYKELWTVSLTIEGHACQHDILWRAFRWEGDKAACDGLNGLTAECHQRTSAIGGKNGSITRKARGHYGLGHCHAVPVAAINKKTGEVHYFESCKQCADALGLYPNHVSECSRDVPKRKSTGGYFIRRVPK